MDEGKTIDGAELKPCPDCESSDFVHAKGFADSYNCRVSYNVACRNPKCQERFWPDNKMPRCTGGYETEEKAIEAWNEGRCFNYPFTFGGRYTGD